MTLQHRTRHQADRSPTLDSIDAPETQLNGGRDDVAPVREAVRSWALEALVAAYGRDTHRLLTDLADRVEASVAYVDRPTVEAHLERPLTDADWSKVAAQFTALAFDEHVGDAGTLRTDWIEDTLHRAGVPGRTPSATPTSGSGRRPRLR